MFPPATNPAVCVPAPHERLGLSSVVGEPLDHASRIAIPLIDCVVDTYQDRIKIQNMDSDVKGLY